MSLRDDMQQALAGWADAVPENWREAIGAPNLEADELIEAQDEEGAYAPYVNGRVKVSQRAVQNVATLGLG